MYSALIGVLTAINLQPYLFSQFHMLMLLQTTWQVWSMVTSAAMLNA